jgi:hypothetical protein
MEAKQIAEQLDLDKAEIKRQELIRILNSDP